MKSLKETLFRGIIIVLIVGGLAYSYFNVLKSHFKSGEKQQKIEEITETLIDNLEQSERVECQASIYLKLEDEYKPDSSQPVQMIHDFKYHRLQTINGNTEEILEYGNEIPTVYSRGISPVYDKENMTLKKVPTDRWMKYGCEKMYGDNRKAGKSEMISYGYLMDSDDIIDIESNGKEVVDDKNYYKYTAIINNTLKSLIGEKSSDNELRQILGAYGIDTMELKKGYPDVYKRMKNIYDENTEKLEFWLDEEGKLIRIEKDYTFIYYLNIMKENSEKIREQVGYYDYPQVIYRQDYKYSPTCSSINMPQVFEEL